MGINLLQNTIPICKTWIFILFDGVLLSRIGKTHHTIKSAVNNCLRFISAIKTDTCGPGITQVCHHTDAIRILTTVVVVVVANFPRNSGCYGRNNIGAQAPYRKGGK